MTTPTTETLQPPPRWLSWTVWGLAAAFCLTAFYLRAAPAVMTAELMRDFHIGAGQLGNLSAFYFYFYVLGSITAAAGTFLFASTDSSH